MASRKRISRSWLSARIIIIIPSALLRLGGFRFFGTNRRTSLRKARNSAVSSSSVMTVSYCPERPALHRRRYHTDGERGNWARGRFANRGCTGLHALVRRKADHLSGGRRRALTPWRPSRMLSSQPRRERGCFRVCLDARPQQHPKSSRAVFQ
jgi:hypothetical protein